jgi:hypothetical protein
MSNNNRELSQIAAFLEVVEPLKNIHIKTPQGENIGIGTTVPIAKVDIIGNVRVSGILTAQSIVSSNSNTLQNVNVLGVTTSVNLNITGVTTTARLAVPGITTTQNLTVVGISTFQNNAYFGDNDSLYFGDGSDLQIYHNGSNTFISNTVGDLYLTDNGGAIRIQAVSGESSAVFNGNGSAELYHDNSKKFETTAGGAIVTGILTATTLIGTVAYASSTGFSTTSSYAINAGLSTSATFASYTPVAGFATNTTYSTTSGVSTAVNGTADITLLRVSGISTFTNGPLLIGAATSTGTASQRLQVTGGGYVSGNLGIGSTNPALSLDVIGGSGARIGLATCNVIIGGDTGRSIEVGSGTSTIDCYIDLHGANVAYPDYASRLTRNAGTNSNFSIFNRGTGSFQIVAQDAGNIQLLTNNTEALRVDSSQRLGLGITTPAAKLHVVGGPILVGSATSSAVANQNLQVYGGAYFSNTNNIGFGTTAPRSAVEFVNNVYFSSAIAVGNTSAAGGVLSVNGGIGYSGGFGTLMVTSTTNAIPTTIYSNASGSTMQIFAGGLLSASSRGGQIDFVGGASTDTYPGQLLFRTGIGTGGTSQPITARLDTAGVMYANTFTSTSDERKKENIETVENASEILNELRGVKFNWKDSGKPSVGVIAQEVEKVLPEAVETDADGMKSVSYDMLIGVLIETVKEQQRRIDALEEKLNGAE